MLPVTKPSSHGLLPACLPALLPSYVPFLADIFSIVPLSLNEWALVLAYSLPVIFIDEVRGH